MNGKLKRIDEYERVIVLTDGTRIRIDEIIDIGSGLFVEEFCEEE